MQNTASKLERWLIARIKNWMYGCTPTVPRIALHTGPSCCGSPHAVLPPARRGSPHGVRLAFPRGRYRRMPAVTRPPLGGPARDTGCQVSGRPATVRARQSTFGLLRSKVLICALPLSRKVNTAEVALICKGQSHVKRTVRNERGSIRPRHCCRQTDRGAAACMHQRSSRCG
jgi:hypothetical protein